MSLERELKEIIINDLGIRDIEVDRFDDTIPLFGEGLGLDSLDAVELVVLLKKRYGIDAEVLEKRQEVLTSIRTLADFIRAHRQES